MLACCSFFSYFRELETELLLVATHFIQKDKDLRLPTNLKVSEIVNDLCRPLAIHLLHFEGTGHLPTLDVF